MTMPGQVDCVDGILMCEERREVSEILKLCPYGVKKDERRALAELYITEAWLIGNSQ
jgi:hypothetical protein